MIFRQSSKHWHWQQKNILPTFLDANGSVNLSDLKMNDLDKSGSTYEEEEDSIILSSWSI